MWWSFFRQNKTRISDAIYGTVYDKRLSHLSVKFVLHRNNAEPYLWYTRCHYQFRCKYFIGLLIVALAKMGIKEVMDHLNAGNQGDIGMSRFLENEFLWWIFLDKGIQWKCQLMQLKESNSNKLGDFCG